MSSHQPDADEETAPEDGVTVPSEAQPKQLSRDEIDRTRELLGLLSNSSELKSLLTTTSTSNKAEQAADETETTTKEDHVQSWFETSRMTRRALKAYIIGQDLLPDDTNSFFITAKPISLPFWVGIVTMVLKMGSLLIVSRDIIDVGDSSNPFKVPAGVDGTVRLSQIVSLLLSNLSQEDVTNSLRIMRNGYSYNLLRREFPDVADESDMWLWIRWNYSFLVRLAGGIWGQFLTFVLIMQADSVLNVLLNYAAMAFIADIDNKIFALGKLKLWGAEVARHAELVSLSDNPDAGPTCLSKFSHTIGLLILYVGLFAGWLVIAIKQDQGVFLCNTIRVRFEDGPNPSLGAFNGLYDRVHVSSSSLFAPKRVVYLERRSKLASFFYCVEQSKWVFRYKYDEGKYQLGDDGNLSLLNDIEMDFCSQSGVYDFDAFSATTTSFDLLETISGWYAKNEQSRAVPLYEDVFAAQCYDCDSQLFGCGGHGVCSSDYGCQCDDGWFGIQCELQEPCREVTTDVRGGEFFSNRGWASTFGIVRLQEDGSVLIGGKEGEILTIYDRPMFVYDYYVRKDIMFYTGRRWALAINSAIPAFEELSDLPAFADTFHAYYSNYSAAFLSESVDIAVGKAMPVELQWFLTQERVTQAMQAPDTTRPANTALICTDCDNVTNPCFFGEFCSASSKCQCSSTGSVGVLCQIPPMADGRCDALYNTWEFQHDGGDCCEQECKSSRFQCGRDETGFLYRGFPDCRASSSPLSPLFPSTGGSIDISPAAISNNGAVLAGTQPDFYGDVVKIYDQDGSQMIQRGQPVGIPSWWTGGTAGFGRSIAVQSLLPTAVANILEKPTVSVAVGCGECEAAFVTICGSLGCRSDDAQALGADTNREAHRFGHAVSMSIDAEMIAVSSFGNSSVSGYVKFWRLNSTYYEPFGGLVVPQGNGNLTQHVLSVDLSGDGSVVAVVSGDETGQMSIQTFALNGTSWLSKGEPIRGSFCLDADSKYNQLQLASLSDNGNRLAAVVGGVGVQVFQWKPVSGDGWTLMGNSTLSVIPDEDCRLEQSLSLNGDGRVVVIGSNFLQESWMEAFHWLSQEWNPIGGRSSLKGRGAVSATGTGTNVAVSIGPVEETGTPGSTTMYALGFPQCVLPKKLFRFSFVVENGTQFVLKDRDNDEVLHQGGPYYQYIDHTVVEEVCVDHRFCHQFLIENATQRFAIWDEQSIGEASNYIFGRTC